MMRIPSSVKVAAAAVAVGFAAAACSSGTTASNTTETTQKETTTSASPASNATSTETIVDVASANPDFSTLVTAVTAAGLGETLQGAGPFTVFAPTNEAFAKIPADQLQAILADKVKLTSILTYHVVPGEVMAADLEPTQMVKTVEGQDVEIKVDGTKATINGCNIVKTDVAASNGVIHVIDCVLVPPAQ